MKELIVEANYTEFRKRYASGRPFALISGFQGDMDVSQNKKNNITLRKKMKDQGYEFWADTLNLEVFMRV